MYGRGSRQLIRMSERVMKSDFTRKLRRSEKHRVPSHCAPLSGRLTTATAANTTRTSMSDSDNDRPPAAQTAKQRERDRRRAALARLKDASQSRRQPRFLGADKDSADGDGDAQDDEPVDFERWARESARRRGKNPNSDDRAAANDSSRRRSASPLRDPTLSRAFDDLFDLGGAGEGGAKTGGEAGEGEVAPDLDDDEAPAKKRRIVAKLDEDRLLGPNGFPLLRQHMQKFKPKGKGHEVRRQRVAIRWLTPADS